MTSILYAREQNLDVGELRRVLIESGLGKIRPIEDIARLQALIDGANLIVTARLDTQERPLIGFARGVTDSSWCCYVADLAVCASAQGLGIGKGLLDESRRQLGPTVSLILVSVPEAVGFYERAGMTRVAETFMYRRVR